MDDKHKQDDGISRRSVIQGLTLAAAGISSLTATAFSGKKKVSNSGKGRVKQSLAAWCFTLEGEKWSLDKLCQVAKEVNVGAIEIVGPEDFATLKKHGLVCSLTNSHMFVRGMNNPLHWKECLHEMEKSIDATAAAGFPNVITFTGFYDTSGKEKGSKVTLQEGIANCVKGYKKIVGYAEKKKINLCLEMLNSRDPVEMKGHPGYMGDHVDICMEIINKVGSPRLKLLFDVYHVQIMDGDIIRRIRALKDHIGHVHLAGNPGRHEMDETQEINYPPVMKALADIGFNGYACHEWIPTRNPQDELRKAVALCTV